MILINGQYVEIDERHFFLISSGLTKYNSYQLNVVLTLMYTTSTSLLIFSTPIPFLYRYSIIVSNKGWGFRQFFIAITINILSTLPENIFGAFALIFPESEFQYRTRFLDKRVWHNTKTDAWRMFVMTEKENKWYLATLGYIVLMVPIIYSIVLYCCIKIKLKISKVNATNRLVTIQKNSYNSQIDAVLLCQAIIPLIFALLPYFFWTLCIIFKADFLKTFSPLMWMHVSWIPTVECLATIFLVKDFRNGIFTFWRKEIYPEFTKMNPAGKLATRAESVILKNANRLCGSGGVLGTAPIVQNKAYFEVTVQQIGTIGIGLANRSANLSSIPVNQNSWYLREDFSLWSNGEQVSRVEGSISAVRGQVFPMLFVDDGAILDVKFKAFTVNPPPGYEEIMLEQTLL
uniref:G protein-coupled receptor n=1 Tax=Rhabditophanes sp. KR3021 TaxID=114890 RepID=A0AC35TQJ5_9BILA